MSVRFLFFREIRWKIVSISWCTRRWSQWIQFVYTTRVVWCWLDKFLTRSTVDANQLQPTTEMGRVVNGSRRQTDRKHYLPRASLHEPRCSICRQICSDYILVAMRRNQGGSLLEIKIEIEVDFDDLRSNKHVSDWLTRLSWHQQPMGNQWAGPRVTKTKEKGVNNQQANTTSTEMDVFFVRMWR